MACNCNKAQSYTYTAPDGTVHENLSQSVAYARFTAEGRKGEVKRVAP